MNKAWRNKHMASRKRKQSVSRENLDDRRFGLLNHHEMERMRDLLASGPLIYRPEIDDRLIEHGLMTAWEPGEQWPYPSGIGATTVAIEDFYDKQGSIRPKFYDFEARDRVLFGRKKAGKKTVSRKLSGLRWTFGDAAKQKAVASMKPGDKLWKFTGSAGDAQYVTGYFGGPLYAVAKRRPITGESLLGIKLWEETEK